MPKHTPSPWTHRAGNNTTNDYVKGPDGELIAMVYAPYPSANARLISVAPEMLKVLQELVWQYEQLMVHAQLAPSAIKTAIAPILAVIEKATV